IQIRSLLGPDDWKDGKRLPEQVAKDDLSQIVTGLRLENLDPFVPIFVLRMMKQGLHKVGRLRNAAVIQSSEISVCLRGVGKCREAVLRVPINKRFIDVNNSFQKPSLRQRNQTPLFQGRAQKLPGWCVGLVEFSLATFFFLFL